MKRLIARIAMVVTLAVAMGGAVATPAQAALNCPAGTGCIWTGYNGTGTRLVISWSAYGTLCWNLTFPLDNNIESARHTYGNFHQLVVYQGYGCNAEGPWLMLEYGQDYNFGSIWANRISSFEIV